MQPLHNRTARIGQQVAHRIDTAPPASTVSLAARRIMDRVAVSPAVASVIAGLAYSTPETWQGRAL